MKIFIFVLLAFFAAADHPVGHHKAPAPHAHHNTYLYHGHYPGKVYVKSTAIDSSNFSAVEVLISVFDIIGLSYIYTKDLYCSVA